MPSCIYLDGVLIDATQDLGEAARATAPPRRQSPGRPPIEGTFSAEHVLNRHRDLQGVWWGGAGDCEHRGPDGDR